ncbi:transposase [Candidatus Enterovibrio escicola]|uniref:transposase n=1 Tax=Candidatus Enterovibrio escicola TaxID=1927127 RepID=UPI000BE45FE1|nr:transposase [Candidatus Enterovibrio escacola]
MINVSQKFPTYTCISKYSKIVEVTYRLLSLGAVNPIIIDATGLKVYEKSECKTRKHGKVKRRIWCKLHLAVDVSTHEVIAAEVSADCAYDTEIGHHILENKGIVYSIQP